MKFTYSAILLASALGMALAQDSSSMPESSSAASSSSAPASSSSSMPASSSSAGGAAGGSATPAATCTLLSGDPRNPAFGCPEGATTVTPPYNSESVLSYLVGAYSVGREGEYISDVAKDLANSVTRLYPTLSDYSAIVTQYEQALNSKAGISDAALSSFNVPSGLAPLAAIAIAFVAGGAFVL